MAIAFNAQNSDTAFFTATDTVAVTVGTLVNGVLIIDVARGAADISTISTITVNGSATGVTFSNSSSFIDTGDTLARVDRYYKINPASGVNTVVVTLAASVGTFSVGVHSWQGVHQTTPLGAAGKVGADSAGPVSVAITTTSGDVVLDAVAWGTGGGTRSATVGAGQTQRINQFDGTGVAVSSETASGASTTMSWTLSTATQWATLAQVLAPVTAGAFTLACAGGTYAVTGTAATPTTQTIQTWFRIGR